MAGLPGLIIKVTADTKDAIDGLNRVEGAVGKPIGAFEKFGTAALAAGAAVAAAFSLEKVISFMQDAMTAAMEDEKSMVALAKAMDNVGLSAQNAQAEGLIKSMMLQYGIADDQLRPAYQRLVTATKDVGQAQELLQVALDLSAAGYADTESAAKALSAAAMGNFTALQRLKVPIDANTIASKDFEGAISQLNAVVGGQAAAASETYAGKLNRINVAAGEAQETIGYALLNAIDNVSKSMGGVGGLTTGITQVGNGFAGLITDIGNVVSKLGELRGATEDARRASEDAARQDEYSQDGYRGIVKLLPVVGFWLDQLSRRNEDNARALGKSTTNMNGYSTAVAAYDPAARSAAAASFNLAAEIDGVGGAANDAILDMANLADAAVQAARIAKGAFAWAGAETGGTPTAGYTDQYVRSANQSIIAAYRAAAAARETANRPRGGGGGSSSAKDEVVALDGAMRRLLQSTNRQAMAAGDLARKFGADEIGAFSRKMLAAGKITSKTKDEFESMVGTIRDRLNTALDSANRELDDWQRKYDDVLNTVSNGIRSGNGIADAASAQADAVEAMAEAQKAYDQAVAGGDPDDVAKATEELNKAKAKQGTFLSFLKVGADTAEAFAAQMEALTSAGATLEVVQQIAAMGARTGSRIAAELLAGGAEAINQANRMVTAVQDSAVRAGTVAAQTFYGAGLASAQAYVSALQTAVQPLLQQLLDGIAAQIAAALQQPVNADIGGGGSSEPAGAATSTSPFAATTAAVEAAFSQYTPASGPSAGTIQIGGSWFTPFADGGIVTGPTLSVVGEAGPEAIIPLSRAGAVLGGGNTYQITVQAGIGDPRAIGQQVVEAITRFERANGPVYAKAV